MHFEAVVFDLDDTLIVESATARRSLVGSAREVLAGLDPENVADVALTRARVVWHAGPHHDVCRALGFASWEGLWSGFDGCHPSVDGLREWAPHYRREAWRHALEALDAYTPETAADMADAYVEHQRRGHPVIDGAAELVTALGSTAATALLTNGPSDIQRTKLRGTGLGDEFDAVVISGEAGVGKPDAPVFSLVLEQLGVAPAGAVMIGDSWERDVVGARNVGMSAIWISDGQPVPEQLTGVVAVPSVAGAAAVLSA